MRPSFLDDMSWAMAEVYGAVTDRILINLAKYFPFLQEGAELPGSFEYQARMLAQMGQVNRETVDILMQSLDGADEALRASLEAAILDALKGEEAKLKKAAQQGLLNGPGFLPPEVTPNQLQAFKTYYAQSADKLNLVNTVMLESTQAAYTATVSDVVNRIQRTQSILNVGTGEVVTGVSSWNTAMHDAVKKMVQNGLTGFVDHGGHHWTPEAYVAMDIRTTMFNTAREAVNERAQEYGCDMYQVSSHNGARPLCYPWQGKVISRSGWRGTVEDLDGNKITVHSEDEIESFRYGGGLFGVNCKHYPMNFIPGFSTIKGEPQNPEENEKSYAESQEQRRLERKLREEKRDLAVMQAQGADPEAIKAQRAKVHKASDDINQFCEDTGRARRRNREYTPVNATWPDKSTWGDVSKRNTPPILQKNVASQATKKTVNHDTFKNVKGVDDSFKIGMSDALGKSQSQEAKDIYIKYADDLVCVNPNLKSGAFFRASSGGVHMNLVDVAKGSSYEEPYEVAFHEFGHMIDWLGGGKNNLTYLSNHSLNGNRLLDVIKGDFQDFKKKLGVSKAVDVIPILKAENMDLKTCGNISDILEKCTGKSYPLGIGHGAAYHKRDGATEKEFFAEVLDSAVTNKSAYDQMVRLFPNAVNMVWELIRSVI